MIIKFKVFKYSSEFEDWQNTQKSNTTIHDMQPVTIFTQEDATVNNFENNTNNNNAVKYFDYGLFVTYTES